MHGSHRILWFTITTLVLGLRPQSCIEHTSQATMYLSTTHRFIVSVRLVASVRLTPNAECSNLHHSVFGLHDKKIGLASR